MVLADCVCSLSNTTTSRALHPRPKRRGFPRNSDKVTTNLVANHDAVCIEDLNVHGLARTKLAKSFNDASFGEFRRQLEYKSDWSRKWLVDVDRWFPSSQIHHACGYRNRDLTLSDREWTCTCGAIVDRDLNAALNIRDEGMRILAMGHMDRINARGANVSPATAGGSR